MAERSYKVVTRKIEYFCDQCDSSAMKLVGSTPKAEWEHPNRPMWRHWCPLCEANVNLDNQYPLYRYEYMENQ